MRFDAELLLLLLITKEQWQTMQSGQQMTIPEEDYNPPVEEEIL